MGLLGAAAAAYQRSAGTSDLEPWECACAVTGGLLLANTTRPYPPLG